MKKVYHVSATGNIKVMEPRVSSHGKSYVYAINNLATGLLFGSQGIRDLGSMISVDENGTPCYTECYPNAFVEQYRGKSCYVYELEPTTFESGKTGWSPELVSEKPVKVLKCTKIENLYEELLKCIKSKKLKLVTYEEQTKTKKGKEVLRQHLKQAIIACNLLTNPNMKDLCEYCRNLYPDVIEEVEKELGIVSV